MNIPRNVSKTQYVVLLIFLFHSVSLSYVLEEDPEYPPTITSVWPTEIKVEEGSTVVFWCEVKGSPGHELSVKWVKVLNKMERAVPKDDDNVISFGSSEVHYRTLKESHVVATSEEYTLKLTIQNSAMQDYGIYICFASNDKGSDAKSGVLLVEENPPSSSSDFAKKHTKVIKIIIFAIFIVVSGVTLVLVYCWRPKVNCCERKRTERQKKKEKTFLNDSVINEDYKNLNKILASSRTAPMTYTPSINTIPVKYTLLVNTTAP